MTFLKSSAEYLNHNYSFEFILLLRTENNEIAATIIHYKKIALNRIGQLNTANRYLCLPIINQNSSKKMIYLYNSQFPENDQGFYKTYSEALFKYFTQLQLYQLSKK